MINRHFDLRSFVDLIERHNPFCFKKESGETCYFKDYTECYLYTLKKMYLLYPRGYVDLPLFIEQQTRLSFNDSNRVVSKWNTMGVKDVMLVDFLNDHQARHDLSLIIKAMHTISETRFNSAMFFEAFSLFKIWQETVKEKELLDYIDENG